MALRPPGFDRSAAFCRVGNAVMPVVMLDLVIPWSNCVFALTIPQPTNFLKGALVGDVTPELTPLRIVIVKMDHLTNLFIALLTIGFVVGFGSGYGIRAGISHYRRSIAKRSRMF